MSCVTSNNDNRRRVNAKMTVSRIALFQGDVCIKKSSVSGMMMRFFAIHCELRKDLPICAFEPFNCPIAMKAIGRLPMQKIIYIPVHIAPACKSMMLPLLDFVYPKVFLEAETKSCGLRVSCDLLQTESRYCLLPTLYKNEALT